MKKHWVKLFIGLACFAMTTACALDSAAPKTVRENRRADGRAMGDYWPSQIHVQNNTSLQWRITARQEGSHTMDSDEWWCPGGTLIPWQKDTVVLGTNRESGIHNNTDFYLTVTLTSGDTSLDLRLKLRGKIIDSSMFCGAAGPGFSDSWYDDRSWHSRDFTVDGRSFTLKYQFYYTGWYDDLIYVIHENNPFPSVTSEDPSELKILSYNIFMLSGILGKDQWIRAPFVPDACRGYDAVVFCEAFDNDVRAYLISRMKDEYPYWTAVLDQSGKVEDGGVIIGSRWPITEEDKHIFTEGTAEDVFAAKGVKYARINKKGKIYHILGTHTQAWNTKESQVNVRMTQLGEIRTFAESLGIPVSEPVILAGDLNVDKFRNAWDEYTRMYQILGAPEPILPTTGATYDGNTNHYAGDYVEYLDYVLTLSGWAEPLENRNEIRIFRSADPTMSGIWDVSDHYGVAGILRF